MHSLDYKEKKKKLQEAYKTEEKNNEKSNKNYQ